MSTRERIADAIEKRANFAALVNAAKGNMGATIGAGLGAAYGGYAAGTGPEGGIGAALGGAALGALGGGMMGATAGSVSRGVGLAGGPSVFKQIAETRKSALDAARAQLGDKARTGFLANMRNLRAARKADPSYAESVRNMAHVDTLAQHGLKTPAQARAAIDQAAASNPYLAYEAAKKKLIYGGIGSALSVGIGNSLVSAGADIGSDSYAKAQESLREKYEATGRLDPRQMAVLDGQLRGAPTA